MKRYVLGFLFDALGNYVALIRKDHPAQQQGKLNGIGGKIKPDETPTQAMRREFAEETNLDVLGWYWFGQLGTKAAISGAGADDDWRVELFRARLQGSTETPRLRPEAGTSEIPCWVRTDDAVSAASWDGQCWAGEVQGYAPVMRNLAWLIPMAQDKDVGGAMIADIGKAAV